MATVRLPGGPTLSYREWGRPDGAVVLLLHGLYDSSATWRHVAPVLGERFRVIAPDARGHGESDRTRDYSFDAMRDDVVGLLEALGILAAIVVGHSMGAVTAYLLAATDPLRIRLLALEELPPMVPANPPRELPRARTTLTTPSTRGAIASASLTDAPIDRSDREASTLGERFAGVDGTEIEEVTDYKLMREFIDRVFKKYLTPRERKILYLYYGLEEGSEAMTLEKIGALLGVTRERIRQIRERAFEKLRESMEKATLEWYAVVPHDVPFAVELEGLVHDYSFELLSQTFVKPGGDWEMCDTIVNQFMAEDSFGRKDPVERKRDVEVSAVQHHSGTKAVRPVCVKM